ncbi:MAG: methyltransferase [Candidatus Methylomirabilia bacterium]
MPDIPPGLRDTPQGAQLRRILGELTERLLPTLLSRAPEEAAGALLDRARREASPLRFAAVVLALGARAVDPTTRPEALAAARAISAPGERPGAESPIQSARLAPRQTGLDEEIFLLDLPQVRLPTRIGRVALEGLKRYFATLHQPRPAQRAIDVGTGSGVLAIVAAKQLRRLGGLDRVWGVDVNPWAVLLARANAALNGESERIDFLESDGLAALCQQGIEGSVDLILSNPPMTVGLPGQPLTVEDRFNVVEHPVEFIKRELIEKGFRLLRPPSGHLLFHISGRFPEALQNLSSIPGFGQKKAVLQGLTELDPYVDLRGLVYRELIQDRPFIFLKGYPVEIQRVTATEAHILRKQGGRLYQQSYVWVYGFQP